MTKAFLKLNRLKYMIRSHEVKDNGFDIVHGRRCITIFSASNYGGSYNNKGAYIVLKSDLVPHIHTFTAGSKKETSAEDDEEEAAEKLAATNLTTLKDLICLHRQQLLDQYMIHDKTNTGRVCQTTWSNVLNKVIKVEIPWNTFLSNLSNIETDGSINYRIFLTRYRLHLADEYASWEVEVIERIQERIFSSRQSLEATFKKFDLDGDGSLDYDEFVKAMSSYDIGLSAGQIKELMRSLDTNGDGSLDFNEFISRFELVYVKEPPPDLNPKARDACEKHIRQLGQYFMDSGWSLSDAFSKFDQDGNGTISREEFKETLIIAGIDLPDSELDNVIHFIDTDHNAKICYAEFVEAFKVIDVKKHTKNWQEAIIRQMVEILYYNRIGLKHAFRFFDRDASGKISADEFRESMRALNLALREPLTDMQIEQLIKAVDLNRDGEIDYKEFCSCFYVSSAEGC